MKTWQMIKELTESPEKRFQDDLENEAGLINGVLSWTKHSKAVRLGKTENWDNLVNINWQEVKEPVPWQEAIQAWLDGKGFRIEMPNGTIIR